MITFKQFIETGLDGAPTMGPNTKSHDDLNVMGRELDISPEDLARALSDTPTVAFSPIHRKGARKGSGPQIVFADKINKDSGSVSGRLMQGNMQKLQNTNGSKSNDTDRMEPIRFRPINRKDASYTYPNLWLEPLKQGGGASSMTPGVAAVPPPPGSMPGMGV